MLFCKILKMIDWRPPAVSWNPGPVTIDIIAKDSVTGFDRRLTHPWSGRLLTNAETITNRLNKLYQLLPMNLKGVWKITSAYRPGEYNTRAGGALTSKHLTCEAVDLSNIGNALGSFLLERLEILERCKFWMEHPEATLQTKHLHLQTKPPRSEKRVFWP